ncbi:MAG: hypothetical protein PVI86_15890 [Phycisphaerae bacterium]|jgi:heme/copper-type cytochrome/quinol oxidase subunit 2
MNDMPQLIAQAPAEEVTLTVGGIVVMAFSIVLVLGLLTFCMTRILGEQTPADHHHTPLDIDTHDYDA